MKTLFKYLIAATLFFVSLLTSNETKAQVNPVSQQQNQTQRNFTETAVNNIVEKLNQNLKLTEKQQAELKTWYTNYLNEQKEFLKKNTGNYVAITEYAKKSREIREAQLKKVLTSEQYKIYKENLAKKEVQMKKQPNTIVKVGGIRFYDKDKILKVTDSVQVGTELKVVVFWTEKSGYSKIIFTDPVKYEPTPEEIKNRQYSFTVKPERTTTYKHTTFYTSSSKKPIFSQRMIKVVDKNGKEIK